MFQSGAQVPPTFSIVALDYTNILHPYPAEDNHGNTNNQVVHAMKRLTIAVIASCY
jgi:hypothetical protein